MSDRTALLLLMCKHHELLSRADDRTVPVVLQRLACAPYWLVSRVCLLLGDWSPIKCPFGSRKWYKNGVLHRKHGPAVIYACGTREWYRNGVRHRDGEPAVIFANGTRAWYQNGERHREGDAPAIIYANGRREWWHKGEYLGTLNAI